MDIVGFDIYLVDAVPIQFQLSGRSRACSWQPRLQEGKGRLLEAKCFAYLRYRQRVDRLRNVGNRWTVDEREINDDNDRRKLGGKERGEQQANCARWKSKSRKGARHRVRRWQKARERQRQWLIPRWMSRIISGRLPWHLLARALRDRLPWPATMQKDGREKRWSRLRIVHGRLLMIPYFDILSDIQEAMEKKRLGITGQQPLSQGGHGIRVAAFCQKPVTM